MYAIYDELDGRTIRVFHSKQRFEAWLCSNAGYRFMSRGYNWRQIG